MRRQIWIDQPKQPDYPRLKAHLITDCVFDGRWLAQLSDPLAFLKDVRDKAGGPSGAYFCAQGADSLGPWPRWQDMTGPEWADWVYDMLQHHIAPNTSADFPICHLNPETDDVGWQMAMLKRWRSRSPRRWTLWSPLVHKAPLYRSVGWEIAKLGVYVSPQCYVGQMERVESSNEVLSWIDIGVPAKRVWPMLDAAALGHWWGEMGGAVAFTQGTLP
jgi:hypothetical protein